MNPILLKENPDLPDFYGVKIAYVTSRSEEFEIVSHRFYKELSMFEVVTKNDQWINFPLHNITKIEFDKNFSKLVALKEEEKKEVS